MCEHGEYVLMNMEVEIDKCLVPLIKTLQEYGITTSACCCGHGQKWEGENINNNIVLSVSGAKVGIKDKNGKAKWWKDPFEFDIWAISFPIVRKRRVNKT